VILLIGQQATFRGDRQAAHVETFTTTADLRERLKRWGWKRRGGFSCGCGERFWFRESLGAIFARRIDRDKIGEALDRQGTLLAELVPMPKIIAELRPWYPKARLVGWKFEVEGGRDGVIGLAKKQIAECQTDAV